MDDVDALVARARFAQGPWAALSLDKRVQVWASHPERKKLNNIHVGGDHTDHVRLMLDLIVLGFWSDSTRISTFMFGNAVSPRNFSFLEASIILHGGGLVGESDLRFITFGHPRNQRSRARRRCRPARP